MCLKKYKLITFDSFLKLNVNLVSFFNNLYQDGSFYRYLEYLKFIKSDSSIFYHESFFIVDTDSYLKFNFDLDLYLDYLFLHYSSFDPSVIVSYNYSKFVFFVSCQVLDIEYYKLKSLQNFSSILNFFLDTSNYMFKSLHIIDYSEYDSLLKPYSNIFVGSFFNFCASKFGVSDNNSINDVSLSRDDEMRMFNSY